MAIYLSKFNIGLFEAVDDQINLEKIQVVNHLRIFSQFFGDLLVQQYLLIGEKNQ